MDRLAPGPHTTASSKQRNVKCRPLEGSQSADKSRICAPVCFCNLLNTVVHFHVFCTSHHTRPPLKETSYITDYVKKTQACTVMLGVHFFCSSPPCYLHSALIAVKAASPPKKTHTHLMQPPNQKPRKRLAPPYKGCCSLHQEGRERDIEKEKDPEEERRVMNEDGGRRYWVGGEGMKEGRTQGRGEY